MEQALPARSVAPAPIVSGTDEDGNSTSGLFPNPDTPAMPAQRIVVRRIGDA
jgi:hypothetical protein